jgi:hypothetical protein
MEMQFGIESFRNCWHKPALKKRNSKGNDHEESVGVWGRRLYRRPFGEASQARRLLGAWR